MNYTAYCGSIILFARLTLLLLNKCTKYSCDSQAISIAKALWAGFF